MGCKDVTMETKYAAVFASVQAGRESVTQVCARLGISRKSYYKYLARFASEGLDGLRPRSRRPLTSPAETPPAMVALIRTARADLAAEGWDNGALSIFYRLLREGVQPPSWRTIHRVLKRQELVVAEPRKRPRSSYRSFEFPAPDDCWQIDAFSYLLGDGQPVVVFEVKDDCSRTQIANLAWTAEDTMGAWECLARGIDEFGKPHLLLSDNSLGVQRQDQQHDRVGGEEPDRVGYQADHLPAASSANLREERTRPPNTAALVGGPAHRGHAGGAAGAVGLLPSRIQQPAASGIGC